MIGLQSKVVHRLHSVGGGQPVNFCQRAVGRNKSTARRGRRSCLVWHPFSRRFSLKNLCFKDTQVSYEVTWHNNGFKWFRRLAVCVRTTVHYHGMLNIPILSDLKFTRIVVTVIRAGGQQKITAAKPCRQNYQTKCHSFEVRVSSSTTKSSY